MYTGYQSVQDSQALSPTYYKHLVMMYVSEGKLLEFSTAVVHHFVMLLCCCPTLDLLSPKKTRSIFFYGFNL